MIKTRTKRNGAIIIGILWLIIALDFAYSFYQHHHMPLGGDFAQIVIPTPEEGYYQVLKDPLGFKVLLKDEIYANPNRFFAHWSASAYFRTMPFMLQEFVEPVESVYLACALAKTLMQLLIVYLLAVFISGTGNLRKLDFLIAAALIIPLFQTSGYNRYMGIIDQSVIYAFFYALPVGLLLLFFLPFYRRYFLHQKTGFGVPGKILLVILMLVLSLNGPLIPGVVLIVCPMVLLRLWIRNYRKGDKAPVLQRIIHSLKQIPVNLLVYFTGISLLCLYSLYIGQNNSLSISGSIPLIDRYARLPMGIYYVFTSKLGFPVLFLMIIINITVMRKHYQSAEAGNMLEMAKWIGIFSLLYILLLPLGGYRMYRENIIRYDTMIPVTLGIMYVFGTTTLYLIRNIAARRRILYSAGVIALLLMFVNSDRPDTKGYECERDALETIAGSGDSIVFLESDCFVMEFRKIDDYRDSDLNGELLMYWNITGEKKLYYQNVP